MSVFGGRKGGCVVVCVLARSLDEERTNTNVEDLMSREPNGQRDTHFFETIRWAEAWAR